MPMTDNETIAPDDKDIFAAALADETPPAPEPRGEDAPEPEDEPDEPDEGKEPEEPAKARAEGEKRKDYRVPAWRLREEAEARRAAEDRAAQIEAAQKAREAEFERERRELAEERRRYAASNAPKPQPAPDVFENPQAYQAYQANLVERTVAARLIDMSFDDAKETHGAAFDEAWTTLTKEIERGNLHLRDQIVAAPNPGRALMRWHNERKAISEIGTDPAAYKQRVQEEARKALMADPSFREELLASMRAEASGNGQSRPNSVTRLPPSLNRATGSRSNEAEDTTPMSDAEVFRHVARR